MSGNRLECEHGWFVGLCEICKRDRDIATLKAKLDAAEKQIRVEREIKEAEQKGSKMSEEKGRDILFGRPLFGRQELQDIRERADEMSATYGMNAHWVRAYDALADAANNLDAMFARCTERSCAG